MKENKRILLLFILLLCCLPAPRAHGATNLVRMFSFFYVPTNLVVAPGDTVQWTNTTLTGHDTMSTTGLWDSPTFTRPGTFSFRFTNAGVYPYICSVHIASHPESTGTVTVAASSGAPTVTITSPADGSDFSAPASFSFTANAIASAGTVTNVEFYAGETRLGSDALSPFSINVSNLAAGSYPLTARATDSSGLSATSSPVRIVVGNSRLVKVGSFWFSPTNLTINSGDTVVWSNTTLTAHDTTATTGLWASPTFTSPATYSFKFTNAGFHPYFCAVHIAAHPEQTGTVTVVSGPNLPPLVAITNPANGTTFIAPARIVIAVSAADGDGVVTNVWFYQGTTRLGEDNTSPYSLTWSNVPAGSYTLSAVAADNLGATNVSLPVQITVTNAAADAVILSAPITIGGTIEFNFGTQPGRSYSVERIDNVGTAGWEIFTNLSGTGTNATVRDSTTNGPRRFYRVGAQ